MLSSIPSLRCNMSACAFLLAYALAGSNAQTAVASPPQRIQELNTRAAAKLLIHVAKPAYPPIAKVNFVRGSVKLEIRVTKEGRVSEAHVLDGEPILAVAALGAVRKWIYRPYLLQKVAVPFVTYVSVRFNLHPRHLRGRLPTNADQYLERQIRPPEVISHPQWDASPQTIPMRVLVGSKGDIIDATSPGAKEPELEIARKTLQAWKFRPARWGAIAVPWYLTVKVPIERLSLDEVANSTKR